MTPPLYRAWRFDLETGPVLNAAGGISMVEGDASVRQAIWLLLSTQPGERLMKPDYGCDLNKLVFSPNDDTTAGIAMHYVRQAVERWEPRVEIQRIDAGRDPDRPEQLILTLDYRVRATLQTGSLEFSMNLAGEQPGEQG